MTKIEWTRGDDGVEGKTWNPIRGCSRVSPGCDHCYAMGQAHRFSGAGKPFEGLTTIRKGKVDWSGVARFVPEMLDAPLRWKKPRRIFVNSMSDLFHESLSNEEIAAVFGVMAACPQHTFQVLTKRQKRAAEWFKWITLSKLHHWHGEHGVLWEKVQKLAPNVATETAWNRMYVAAHGDSPPAALGDAGAMFRWPLPNVWLGVSAENQETYNDRVPKLVHGCPAALHWVSLEPQLGPIQLRGTGHLHLGWVVQGGESGPGARPFDVAWARSMRDECAETGIPYFLKQLGARPLVPGNEDTSRWPLDVGWVDDLGTEAPCEILLPDRKGGQMLEWSSDLRVRQFPVSP